MSDSESYLVIDLEATCDEHEALPREETEIIEIGAVLVEPASLRIVREFQTFVKPVRHPVLTPFCRKLTSITQEEVDRAPGFPEALARLRDFMGADPMLFCSWGGYDRNQFRRDAAFHRLELPFGDRHLNLKKEFSRRLATRIPFGLGPALARVGLAFEGTPHRGIDDARNIARLLPWVLGRAEFPRRSGSAHRD